MRNYTMKTLCGFIYLSLVACSAAEGGKIDETEAANEAKAVYCLDLLFNKKDMIKGREDCFGETYIQHNPMAADGPDAFFAFAAPFMEANPELTLDIKRSTAKGDMVWVHSHSRLSQDDRGVAVVDIFRMKDGKLVEHWDVVQPVPEKSANANTMF